MVQSSDVRALAMWYEFRDGYHRKSEKVQISNAFMLKSVTMSVMVALLGSSFQPRNVR